jgi:uncharacterized protein (TIGR02001 family)
MLKTKQLSIASLVLMSFSCVAEVSMNAAVTSNYMWRGVTQTGDDAAVSGGIDYNHENGFYAGAWTSNVGFGAGSGSEVDFYVGHTGTLSSIDYDIGYVMYKYPATGFEESDFSEVYLNTSFNNFTLGLALNVNSDIDDDQAFGTGDIYTYASYYFALPQEYSMTLTGGIYNFDEDEVIYGDSDYSHVQVDISKNDFTLSVSKASDESGSDDVKVFVTWAQSF